MTGMWLVCLKLNDWYVVMHFLCYVMLHLRLKE